MSGSIAIIGGLMLPVVIGGVGLGVETGYWYLKQRKLQQIADVSAHAAAVRKKSGDDQAQYVDAARYIAAQSGYTGPPANMSVVSPPTSGPNATKPDAVEVVITESVPRYFTSIFTQSALTVHARAVAKIETRPACILALSGTAAGAVTVSGSAEVTMPQCDIASNSVAADSFKMQGAASRVTAACVYSAGGTSTNSNLTTTYCSRPETHMAPLSDPYADVAEPAVTGTCKAANVGSGGTTTTLTPTESHASGAKSMRFCNGLSVSGNVVLNPGLYIIEKGDFTGSNGANISGTGVTLFFTNGATVKLNGNMRLNLSAPTADPYSGILMFGSRSNTTGQKINGDAASTFQGAIYFPAAHVEYLGSSAGANGCTQLIAKTVQLTGKSNFQSSCGNSGTRQIGIGQLARLVE
ncbi:MAG TPA: pilus assembly protein TadG-related protein [Propylenella sp.]|nr:pilus assembly protein TadG-related protein [Propylenella sp.]